ncbi:hypothetical protein [Flavobacterium sp.]|uniref:hypothetical protein n=1 Tax=Flavobacterium sp. TaxID=239 RepID=UPI0026302318|nr:hypothetical protein [Flavobacterium sp.]
MIWSILFLLVCGLVLGFRFWKQKRLDSCETSNTALKLLEDQMQHQQQLNEQLQTKVYLAKQFQQSYFSAATSLEQMRFELTNELVSKIGDCQEK